jgi:hypothetical protein
VHYRLASGLQYIYIYIYIHAHSYFKIFVEIYVKYEIEKEKQKQTINLRDLRPLLIFTVLNCIIQVG